MNKDLLHRAQIYWVQKGRLDGFTDCEQIKTQYPKLWKAWTKHQKSIARVSKELAKVVGDENAI